MNDEIRYMYPMVLWSVDVIQLTSTLPRLATRGVLMPGVVPVLELLVGVSVAVVMRLIPLRLRGP